MKRDGRAAADMAKAAILPESVVIAPRQIRQMNSVGLAVLGFGTVFLGASTWVVIQNLLKDYPGPVSLTVAAALVGFFAFLAVYMTLAYRNGRMVGTSERVWTSNWLGQVSTLDRSAIARVVILPIKTGRRYTTKTALVLGIDGRMLSRWNAEAGGGEPLRPLFDVLGVTPEVVTEPARAKDVRHTYPGSVSWWAAHTTLSAALVLVILVLALGATQLLGH